MNFHNKSYKILVAMPRALHSRLRFNFWPPDRGQHQQRREQLQQRRVLQLRQQQQHELLRQQQQRELQRQQWQQQQQMLHLLGQLHLHELLQRHQQPQLEVVVPPLDTRIPEILTDHRQYVGDEEARRGAPPASKLAVDKLKKVEIKTADDKKNYNCVICLEGVSVGEVVKEMPCGHAFHAHCIVSWLGRTNSCPVCRFKLPTDNPDYVENKKISV